MPQPTIRSSSPSGCATISSSAGSIPLSRTVSSTTEPIRCLPPHRLARSARSDRPIRIVTHHWSDNLLKGFDVYEQLDSLIADGELKGFELVVIGRWPARIKWRAAQTMPPMNGEKLATELRKCHLYLTASRWEPCGMHHVEGAQCGLPLLYHADGGGINEAGRCYGLEFRDNLAEQLLEMKSRFPRVPGQSPRRASFRRSHVPVLSPVVQSQLCQ